MSTDGTPWIYFAELWGTPDGQIYYKLPNWSGFYVCVPDVQQRGNGHVKNVPDDAVLLVKDGTWTVPLSELSGSTP